MELSACEVGLVACSRYDRRLLKERVDTLCNALGFKISAGSRVLIKPNLVSAVRNKGLACTHPEVVAAVAEWCLDHGAKVRVGDSPAFGTAMGVMASCGISEALKDLPVTMINFEAVQPLRLASGLSVGVARAVGECDLLVNLPKIKAHGQLYLTLAVKNYFGTVVGFRKPWLHARYGDIDNRFEGMLVDLLAVLPGGITLADGVVAMHGDGPVSGTSFPLHLLAGGLNPVALDTALLAVLGLPPEASPVWRECFRRNLSGSELGELSFPLARPEEVGTPGFQAPARLKPVSFHPWRLVMGAIKRIMAG
ncbi:MAG: DUF362 domain-containing protein [Desulfobulbaceae bacterium]|nr:DUF362 domain-containing protein [Desulfobulbaceae bacterium]HIJ91646.1 DUF362 domain-containing protein [Deltaproteobacteria bacterium]